MKHYEWRLVSSGWVMRNQHHIMRLESLERVVRFTRNHRNFRLYMNTTMRYW